LTWPKSMKKPLLWSAFASVFLVLLCPAIFAFANNVPAEPTASGFQPSTHLSSANPTAPPVPVPQPTPKAVSFYHSTMLLIAVTILWSLLILVGFLFTGVSAKLRSWAQRLGHNWYFSYAIY